MADRRTLPLFAAIGVLPFSAAGQATEICVKCTGPDASYACVVNTTTPASTIDTPIKLYCITALAKAGPHASCAIDRDTKPPCQGERRELPLPDAIENALDAQGAPQIAEPTNTTSTAPPGTTVSLPANAVTEPPPSEDAPPKTVQEMVEKGAKSAGAGISETGKSAGKAAESTGTALQKAGSAVAKAAKNSWECLSSFFSKC